MFNRKLKKQVKKLKTELTKNSFKVREMESWNRAFKYRLDEMENIVDEQKEAMDVSLDVIDKILNDYFKLLQKEVDKNTLNIEEERLISSNAVADLINEYLLKRNL
jgi:hypothetical protein